MRGSRYSASPVKSAIGTSAASRKSTAPRAATVGSSVRLRSRCVIGLDAIRFNERAEYNLYFGAV